MHYLIRPVFYLDSDDIDAKGNVMTIPFDKPLFILIQSLKCYHCTKSKPAFQEFAERNKGVACATIQVDSPKMNNEFIKKLEHVYPDLIGFPSYILHYKGRKIVYDGDRSLGDMERFVLETLNS